MYHYGTDRIRVDAAAVGRSLPACRAANSYAKRAFDLIVSAAALVFVAPLLLVTAAAIWAESGGPVLFTQQRTGLNGRIFRIYKFRSLTVMEDGHAVRQVTRGDARITQVGRFIRKTSIDELPQLINVLAGDMSLVGPRPHAVVHDEQFGAEISGYRDRFLVRPGITGWAQVCGHRGETQGTDAMAQRIQHDLEYVRGWSLWLDLKILLRTAVVVTFDRAAF